jgi:hypothetical protein
MSWAILIILLALGVLLVSISNLMSIIGGAFPISSSRSTILKAFNHIDLKPGQTFVDLGCRWGTVLNIAKWNYKMKVVGYEISPLPYLIAKLRFQNVYYQTVLKANLSRADVIFVYLSPSLMKQLELKFKQAIQEKKMVLSLSFPIPNQKAIRKIKVNDVTLYVY